MFGATFASLIDRCYAKEFQRESEATDESV